jgi:hypothetical protein
MTLVGLVSGGWGQNIGNAFFNMGGRHVLETAGNHVQFVQDSPAYWTFRNQRRGAYSNAFDMIRHLRIELLVLQGPLFTATFPSIWLRRLRHLRSVGTSWAVLSGAFRRYDQHEKAAVDRVFSQVPPKFVFTRDTRTSEVLGSLGYPAVTAVDTAFFVSDVVPPAQRRESEPPIVIFGFDHFVEPELIPDPHGVISIGGARYTPTFPPAAEAAARRGKAWSYLYQPLDRRKLPDTISGHVIVRPEHRTNPHIPLKIYRRGSGIASDEPWTYLALYSTTELTFSDRVHACVATLAYGRPALLHNPSTRRSELFSAVGATGISREPTYVDQRQLADLKRTLIARVRAATAG